MSPFHKGCSVCVCLHVGGAMTETRVVSPDSLASQLLRKVHSLAAVLSFCLTG